MRLSSRVGRRLAVGLAAASAAIVIPAAAMAASGEAAHQAALPRCQSYMASSPGRHGAYVWLAQPGNAGTGTIGYDLEITNTGRHACSLRGAPRVAAIRDGHLVGTPAPGSSSRVVLGAGQTAHVSLSVLSQGIKVCAHPVTAGVVVYLPGQATAQPAWMDVLACSRKPGGGVLAIAGIMPGIGVPLP
jgi:hypothetical protein